MKVSLVCSDEDFLSISDLILKTFPEMQELSTKDAGLEQNRTKISFKVMVCCKNAVDYIFNQFKNEEKILAISVKELSE